LVSIHTPVWGVTILSGDLSRFFIVSIHTPVWGVTANSGRTGTDAVWFQSTRPYGA